MATSTEKAESDNVRSAPEEQALRESVRELAAQWLQQGRYVPRSDSWLRSSDPAFSRALGEEGLLGVSWPREYGGRGGTNVTRFAVVEELLRAGAPVAYHWMAERQIGPQILKLGTDRLKAELLPPITRGELCFSLGMSEPEAGSDLASVRTVATRVAGGWRIDGRKIWTSLAQQATHGYLLARTSQSGAKHTGLSEFLLDMDTPGITVSPIVDMSGEHHFNEVLYENVFVPEHRLLGIEGNGWTQVVEQLSFERGGPERVLSTYPLLVELLRSEAPLPERTRLTLGVLIARLAIMRKMSRQVSEAVDAGGSPISEAATLKYLGNIFEHDVIEAARPVLGTDPQRGTAFAEAILASPGFSVRGGAADVLLDLIAKREVGTR